MCHIVTPCIFCLHCTFPVNMNESFFTCLSARRAPHPSVKPLPFPLHPRSALAPPLVLAHPPRGVRSFWESMWASGSGAWAHPAVRRAVKETGWTRGEERRERGAGERRGDARRSCCKSAESCRTLRFVYTSVFSLLLFVCLNLSIIRLYLKIQSLSKLPGISFFFSICWASQNGNSHPAHMWWSQNTTVSQALKAEQNRRSG